jgi:hypothetical protein
LINSGSNKSSLKGILKSSFVKTSNKSNDLVLPIKNQLKALKRERSEILTKYNSLLSGLKDSEIIEGLKQNRTIELEGIKNDLISINLQIVKKEINLRKILKSEDVALSVVSTRKTLLGDVAGKLLLGIVLQNQLHINSK